MAKKDTFTRVLAIVGTVLAWFPILAPVVLTAIRVVSGHTFLFDFLMPAELFPSVLAGGGLLIWAALRAHSRRVIVGWGLGLSIGLLVGAQGLAVVTGLASGETQPEGWPWILVLVALGGFWLALVALATGGALLVRDLFRPSQPPPESI